MSGSDCERTRLCHRGLKVYKGRVLKGGEIDLAEELIIEFQVVGWIILPDQL